jgi:type I restriction enzyme S subunit
MTNLPREGIRLVMNDVAFVRVPKGLGEAERTRVRSGDVLISITAELGKIGLVDAHVGEAFVNQHVALVRPTVGLVWPEYLAHYLASPPQRRRLQCLNDAGAKAGLNLEAVSSFAVGLPPLDEQRRVSEILAAADSSGRVVDRLLRVELSRRAWLRKTTIDEPVAARAWPCAALGDVVRPVTRRNIAGVRRVLTTSAKLGLVDQSEYFSRDVSGSDLSGYHLLKRGEFAYNRSTSLGYPCGAVKRLDGYGDGAVSTLYICFELVDKRLSSDFLNHFFESGIMNRELGQICQVGSRAHGLLNVTKSDFYALPIAVPARAEQERVVAALDTADREIEILQDLAACYRRQRQALVAALFPREREVA